MTMQISMCLVNSSQFLAFLWFSFSIDMHFRPGECIMAEFDFSVPPQPMETFPVDQGVPRWTMYNMKAHLLPEMYWQMLK